jgi:hypothetical protein
MKIPKNIIYGLLLSIIMLVPSCGEKALEDKNQILEQDNKNMKEKIVEVLKETGELKEAVAKIQAENKQLGSNVIQQQELLKLKDSQLAQKSQEETNLTDTVKQLTSSIEDLKREKNQGQQQNTSLLLNKIAVMLGHIQAEPRRNYPTWSDEDYQQEESRLNSLANANKSEIDLQIAELRSTGFKESENLQGLVDDFVKNYGFWVSYEFMKTRHFYTFNEWDANLTAKAKEFEDQI